MEGVGLFNSNKLVEDLIRPEVHSEDRKPGGKIMRDHSSTHMEIKVAVITETM